MRETFTARHYSLPATDYIFADCRRDADATHTRFDLCSADAHNRLVVTIPKTQVISLRDMLNEILEDWQ